MKQQIKNKWKNISGGKLENTEQTKGFMNSRDKSRMTCSPAERNKEQSRNGWS